MADLSIVVEADQELQLIRNLVEALDHIPGIGLQAGLRYRLATYGIWGFAMLSSPTLRSALEIAVRYVDLSFPFADFHVELCGEEIVITVADHALPEDVRAFIVDRDCASMASVEHDLINATLPVLSATFRRPPPADLEPYRAVFGITPSFDAGENRIVKDASRYLDLPLPGGNIEVARQCEKACQALLATPNAHTGVAANVRDRLAARLGRSQGMEELAAELHMTSRTLRRRLETEGTSFRQLQEEVRHSLAEELLAAGMTLELIAERLGYGDVSNFIRACKRWKGMTPHRYRSQLG